jgi:hypothetical protein
MILQSVQRGVDKTQPFSNFMAGAQQQQQFAGEEQRQNLLVQRGAQQAALAPLQQQAVEQKLQIGQGQLDAEALQAEQQAFSSSLSQLGSAAKTLKPFIEAGDLIGAAGQIDTLERLGVPSEILADIDGLIATGDLGEISNQIATVENLNRANQGEGEIIKSSQRLINKDGQQFSEVDVAMPDGTLKTISTPVGGTVAKKTTGLTAKEQAKLDVQTTGEKKSAELGAELETAPTVEASKEAAKQAIKLSGEAFDRLEGVAEGIGQIDNAINLIDNDAETGVIMSKLPSISESSIALDNLQQRMGLNVVANTTFGALSAGELGIALDSALPTNLSPPDLRRWLVQKKKAQAKLQGYLSEAATFLGTPGNTVADFLQLQKVQSLEAEQGQQAAPQQPSIEDLVSKYAD